MSPEERRRRGTMLCRRLSADVAKIAPAGIGCWLPAWDLVDPVTAEFTVALTAWEAAPSERTRLRVRDAYNAVLSAWRGAVRQFESQRQGA